jgi:hypothetical protein
MGTSVASPDPLRLADGLVNAVERLSERHALGELRERIDGRSSIAFESHGVLKTVVAK